MKLFRNFVTSSLSLLVTLLAVLAAVVVTLEAQLPNVAVLKDVHEQAPLRVYSSDQQLIAEFGSKRRQPVALKQVPVPLLHALIATEDRRFYQHMGVDFIGVVRAVKAVLSSGRKSQGASTITMQVARNYFLTSKKTYARKVREMLLAMKIEREFSKDKILELYLNKVYFGNRAYGVAAAAEVYYGKTLDQLSLAEMAMIAGLPQAPSRNNPITRPQAAKQRRNHVLARMLEADYITEQQYQRASEAPITARYHGRRVALNAPYVAEMARQQLVARYGKQAYDDDYTITTTVSARLQRAASNALQQGLLAYTERHGFRGVSENLARDGSAEADWPAKLPTLTVTSQKLQAAVVTQAQQTIQATLADRTPIVIKQPGFAWARRKSRGWVVPRRGSEVVTVGDVIWVRFDAQNKQWLLTQLPKVQGAIVSLNPQNGAIAAISGGFDFYQSNFNRATQAERQPGSNFKPFIYSAALAHGYTLASMINDAPVTIRQYGGDKQWWRPRNDRLQFYGPTRLRVGLTESRNLVSIRLLQAVGLPFTLDYVQRFGFDRNKLPNSLSLALGSGVVTPLQLVQGYAVFANGGYRISPYLINTIEQGGQVLYQAQPAMACRQCISQHHVRADQLPQPMAPQVITAQNAYLMNKALQGVIQQGTGKAAMSLGREDLGGKTGTTNNKMDAWFSGFDSHLATTVWVGFDNLTTLREYGAQAALPIWVDYMQSALAGLPQQSMPEPPGIVIARINPDTGLLAAANQAGIFEYFRQQDMPTEHARAAEAQSQQEGLGEDIF